jgi:arylsulfatase A-like enzyme
MSSATLFQLMFTKERLPAGVDKLEAQGHFPSAQFRGYKSDIWDGGHRVPFFVRWPGQVKPGSQCTRVICHTDLIATCADIVGVKLPDYAGEDSVSMLPALRGQDAALHRDAVVHHSIAGNFAIRENNWKLELCPGSGGWGNPTDAEAKIKGLPAVQLYDLSQDIVEQSNLGSANPAVVKRLTAMLQSIIDRGRSTPGKSQKNDIPIDPLGAHRQQAQLKSSP